MKQIICIVLVAALGIFVNRTIPLSIQDTQNQKPIRSKSLRLARIPYGEKQNTAPLSPLGVDDVFEPGELDMDVDGSSVGPYRIRVSEDGKYSIIYFNKKLILINNKSSNIEREIFVGKDSYVDFANSKIYSIFHKTVHKDYVDEKGVIRVGATEELWQFEVYTLNGVLLKAETEALNSALSRAIKAGWKPRWAYILYADSKNNIYLVEDDSFWRLSLQQLPPILQISPSGSINYINIKIDSKFLKSNNNYIIQMIVKNERIYICAYFDPVKTVLSIKNKKNKPVRWGYPLQQLDIFIFNFNGEFINHYHTKFNEMENKKYAIDKDFYDIVRIDDKSRLYIKSFVDGSVWYHMNCEIKKDNIESITIDEDLPDVIDLPTFAIIPYIIWMYDPEKQIWQIKAKVEEPVYGGSFSPKTSCWDVDAQGNLYYLKWTKDALEVWMVPANESRK